MPTRHPSPKELLARLRASHKKADAEIAKATDLVRRYDAGDRTISRALYLMAKAKLQATTVDAPEWEPSKTPTAEPLPDEGSDKDALLPDDAEPMDDGVAFGSEGPNEDPPEDDGAAFGSEGPNQDPPEDIEEDQPVKPRRSRTRLLREQSPVKYLVAETAKRKGAPKYLFLTLPVLLVDAGIFGRMEQHREGLGTVFLVLLRFADKGYYSIRATKKTLREAMGLTKNETLFTRLAFFCKPHTNPDLPQYCERLEDDGHTVRMFFVRAALDWTVTESLRVMAELHARYDALKKKRGAAGRWKRKKKRG
jgi:hypothetical protein